MAVNPIASGLSNLAWSNLCKLGVNSGTPEDDLVKAQTSMCINMLRNEVEVLKPTIVLFVSASDADNIVRGALSVTDAEFQKSQDRADSLENVWWLEQTSSRPAVLWTRHPRRAGKALGEYTRRKLAELTH